MGGTIAEAVCELQGTSHRQHGAGGHRLGGGGMLSGLMLLCLNLRTHTHTHTQKIMREVSLWITQLLDLMRFVSVCVS